VTRSPVAYTNCTRCYRVVFRHQISSNRLPRINPFLVYYPRVNATRSKTPYNGGNENVSLSVRSLSNSTFNLSQERAGALRALALQLRSRDICHKNDMNKGVMSDQNRGQMSSGVLKASDGQRNFIKREIPVARINALI
jgi:hypothetical protein